MSELAVRNYQWALKGKDIYILVKETPEAQGLSSPCVTVDCTVVPSRL